MTVHMQYGVICGLLSISLMLTGCVINDGSGASVDANDSSVETSMTENDTVDKSVFVDGSDDFSDKNVIDKSNFTHLLAPYVVCKELVNRGFNAQDLTYQTEDDAWINIADIDGSYDDYNVPTGCIEIGYRPTEFIHWNFSVNDGCLTAVSWPRTSDDGNVIVVLTETDQYVLQTGIDEYRLNGLDDWSNVLDNGEIAWIYRPIRVDAITPEILAKYDDAVLAEIRSR